MNHAPCVQSSCLESNGCQPVLQYGFGVADGELLMILDADLTTAPEKLPKFYDAVLSGRCDSRENPGRTGDGSHTLFSSTKRNVQPSWANLRLLIVRAADGNSG
jgi:hypothetical protein